MTSVRRWAVRMHPMLAALTCAWLAACASAPRLAADAPLETRPRNAVDYEPDFPGQTRAPGVRVVRHLDVHVITNKLNSPWAVEPLPDGRLLVTEKPGQLRIVTQEGQISERCKVCPQFVRRLRVACSMSRSTRSSRRTT